MNVTLNDEESNFDKQSENSYPDEEGNYMAFASMVKSESLKNQ